MANLSNINNKLIVTDGGNLLVNATANLATYGGITIDNFSDPSIAMKTTGTSGWLWTQYITSSGTNNFSMGVNQSSPYWCVKAGAGMDSPHLVVDSSGDVGIGTITPDAKLTIGDPGGATTRSIQIEGNTSVSGMNGTIGYFSNALYISNNYYYNSAQVHPISTYGQTNIVQQTSTVTGGNFIDFNVSDHTDPNNAPDTRMRILDSGNVGIGVTVPGARLELDNPSAFTNMIEYGNVAWNQSTGHGLVAVNRGSDGYVQLQITSGVDNADVFTIRNSGTGANIQHNFLSNGGAYHAGNVGIGVTNNGGNGGLMVTTTAGVFSNANQKRVASFYDGSVNANNPGIILGYDDSSTPHGIVAARTQTGSGIIPGLQFFTYDGGWGPRMTILNSGNVGIGTTSPVQKLDVNGNIYAKATAATVDVVAFNTTSGLLNSDLHLAVTSSGEGQVRMYGNYPLTFYNNNTERMRIDTNGELDITGGGRILSSGGIFLGSNNNSNLLDDYEEGTFTATTNNDGVGAQFLSRYTKVGQLVTYTVYLSGWSPLAAGNAIVVGFPFTAITSYGYGVGNVTHSTGILNCAGGYHAGTAWYSTQNNSIGQAPWVVAATRYTMISGFYYTTS